MRCLVLYAGAQLRPLADAIADLLQRDHHATVLVEAITPDFRERDGTSGAAWDLVLEVRAQTLILRVASREIEIAVPRTDTSGDAVFLGGSKVNDPSTKAAALVLSRKVSQILTEVEFGDLATKGPAPALPTLATDPSTTDPAPPTIAAGAVARSIDVPPVPATARPRENAEPAQFTVAAPAQMRRGGEHAVIAYLHPESQRTVLMERVHQAIGGRAVVQQDGAHQLQLGSQVEVRLSSSALTLDPPYRCLEWRGDLVCASFAAAVPADCPPDVLFTARFCVQGLEVARTHVSVRVVDRPDDAGAMAFGTGQRPRRAFASHASQDKREVLGRIQGMQAITPGLDVFYDVASLRQGQRWENGLREAIEQADVFYLFWSRAARKSHWVKREWNLALDTKGIDFICPVPLVPPQEAPPPAELAGELHFNHWVLPFQDAATRMNRETWWERIVRRWRERSK